MKQCYKRWYYSPPPKKKENTHTSFIVSWSNPFRFLQSKPCQESPRYQEQRCIFGLRSLSTSVRKKKPRPSGFGLLKFSTRWQGGQGCVMRFLFFWHWIMYIHIMTRHDTSCPIDAWICQEIFLGVKRIFGWHFMIICFLFWLNQLKPLFYQSSFGHIFGLSTSSKSALSTKDVAGSPRLVIFDGFNAEERPVRETEVENLRYSMDVSKNNGTSKSSILIGFSIINHPFWGATIFGNIWHWKKWWVVNQQKCIKISSLQLFVHSFVNPGYPGVCSFGVYFPGFRAQNTASSLRNLVAGRWCHPPPGRFGHYVRQALPEAMRVLDMQDFHALRLGTAATLYVVSMMDN